MRSLLLHIIACFLRLAAAVFKVMPLKRRVVFLSRQSLNPSRDFMLLAEVLRHYDPNLDISFCLAAPETTGLGKFAKKTLEQLKLTCTSSVIVIDGYLPAVSVPKKRSGVTIIQMWHALGAIKQFGYQCLDTPDGRTSKTARILRMHRNYDVVIAGGPWAVKHLAAAFAVPACNIVPAGLPRLDYLTSDLYAEKRQFVRDQIIDSFPQLENGTLNIVYAPTFRRNDNKFAQNQLAIVRESMTEVSATLVLAGHPLEGGVDNANLPNNLIVNTGFSTIDLLSIADALITDYSAIAYEAAALGVPVFFYVPDIQDYRISPGLNVNPLRDYVPSASSSFSSIIQMTCDRLDSGCTFADSIGPIPDDCTDAIARIVLDAI